MESEEDKVREALWAAYDYLESMPRYNEELRQQIMEALEIEF